MAEKGDRDPATGLLSRQAFLEEVREAHRLMPLRLNRGCLLILHFPVIQSMVTGGSADELSADSADDAMLHLLAIVETRVRTRDTLGRISRHSLCILLKGCNESDAIIVADQYAALLRDIVVKSGKKYMPMDMRYRIVPLDSRGKRSRQGVSRLVVAPPIDNFSTLSKQIDVAGNIVDLSSSKVVSLNAMRTVKPDSHPGCPVDDPAHTLKNSVLDLGGRDRAHAWRLRPGMLVQRKPLVCCHRLQPMGIVNTANRLQDTDLFISMLTALGLSSPEKRPIVESQLILPVQANQIQPEFPQWLAERCKQMRVAPSDICLSFSVDSLAPKLRNIAPILRQLNSNGIRLMLEGAASANQFRMMKNVAQFDSLFISGRTLNDSLTKIAMRVELEAVITEAREHQCEICAGGIDSAAMLIHATTMQIEIGFGRQCGASTAFPEEAWTRVPGLAES
ncbi:MAG: EAL domain-containing protein [Granulosicoccus sp.]